MAKKILKEACIMILLCATIALILAVVFYDYIPINKTVPEPIAYSMPDNLNEVKKELENSVQSANEKVVLTYEIDETDLAGYKQTKTYNAGKADPFAVYDDEPATNTNTNNNTIGNTTGNTIKEGTTKSNTTNSASKGTIFDDGTSK